jgi:hypothetical protein
VFGLFSVCSQKDDGFAQVRDGEVAQGGDHPAGTSRVRAETPRMFPTRLTALLALAGALAVPASAGASGPSFGLKALGAPRGYFVYSAGGGSAVQGKVRVVNAGHATGTVNLLAADAATGRTTGVVYGTHAVKDLGTWLRLDRSSLTLAPGASAVVGFTVQVPAGVTPGDHLGGIVAEPAQAAQAAKASSAKHSFHVNVVEQSIVAVQVVAPGAATSALKLTSIHAGGNPGFQTLLVGIANPGQRLVHGSGVVKVLDASGATLRRQSFNVDTFVPGTQVEDPIVVRGKILPAGHYQASVIIRWAGGHSTTLHAPFAVDSKQLKQVYGSKGLPNLAGGGKKSGSSPILIIGGGALLLLVGVGGTALYFRRRTRELERRFTKDTDIRAEDRRPARDREPV